MIQSVSEDIRYIGVDDNDLDLFESQYLVPEGMSYNSYLILDEKIAVLDTSDARAGGQQGGEGRCEQYAPATCHP